MANEQEREKLARRRAVDRMVPLIGGEDRDAARRSAERLVDHGYHTGPRLPDPGSPEEAEAVERACRVFFAAGGIGFDAMAARAVLAALKGQTDE